LHTDDSEQVKIETGSWLSI